MGSLAGELELENWRRSIVLTRKTGWCEVRRPIPGQANVSLWPVASIWRPLQEVEFAVAQPECLDRLLRVRGIARFEIAFAATKGNLASLASWRRLSDLGLTASEVLERATDILWENMSPEEFAGQVRRKDEFRGDDPRAVPPPKMAQTRERARYQRAAADHAILEARARAREVRRRAPAPTYTAEELAAVDPMTRAILEYGTRMRRFRFNRT
jgi:hypothetical protein